MSDMIRKVIYTDVKEVSDRVLEFIGSTETQDRDGELIKSDGWILRNYKKNPVFMWAHDYKQPPIGKALNVKAQDGNLTFKIEFADEETYAFADTIYKLYKGGFLNATSVGFMPKEWSDGDGEKAPRRTYTKQELLELSAVPIPSNPEALQQAVEGGCITTKEFEAITKLEDEGVTETEDIVTKPEETDDFIRIPVSDCKVTATIDISKKEGISALYCGKEKQVRTYLFDKREPYNWTMARAKKWVEEHEKKELDEDKIEPPKKTASQAEIMDELDYLIRVIDTEGMNDDVKEDAWELVRQIMRLTGDDIPDDILGQFKTVLNDEMRDDIEVIKACLSDITDRIEPQEVLEPIKTGLTEEKVTEIVARVVQAAIEKAQGKVD